MTAGKKKRRWLFWLPVLAMFMVCLPIVLLAGAGNPPSGCDLNPASGPAASASAPAPGGMFAAPLSLAPNRWYTVGATEYGGPSDPSSGSYGASGVDLNAFPNSFAELSLLDDNPANHPAQSFTFADANALGNLPYGTGIRVRHGNREAVLYKRDIGYGQGPGQTLAYRIDVWYAAAAQLGISKTPVSIELAPSSGAGSVLGALPGASAAVPASATSAAGAGSCVSTPGLALTGGLTAQINPQTGMASAPADAPAAVKALIAAGNQIIDKPYVWGGGHGQPLSELAAGYDCSGSTSYVLHAGGLLGDSALVAQDYESWDLAGPGRWITVYANSAHVFIDVAGVVMDTAYYSPVTPSTPSTGPRWQPASMISAQINGDLADGNGGFVQRHPQGL
jgi:cell wall-associated NlpC family hydrolase